LVNIKTPRQVIYSSFEGNPGACPYCDGKLVNEYQTFAIATRQGKRIADSFIVGGDIGWFCAACPTVVISRDALGKMLSFQKSGWNIGSEYVVLGVVDLDAIPASNRHLPIGDPQNPLPLIEFSDFAQNTIPSISSNRPKRKRHK
jgi:hypothetical protein